MEPSFVAFIVIVSAIVVFSLWRLALHIVLSTDYGCITISLFPICFIIIAIMVTQEYPQAKIITVPIIAISALFLLLYLVTYGFNHIKRRAFVKCVFKMPYSRRHKIGASTWITAHQGTSGDYYGEVHHTPESSYSTDGYYVHFEYPNGKELHLTFGERNTPPDIGEYGEVTYNQMGEVFFHPSPNQEEAKALFESQQR